MKRVVIMALLAAAPFAAACGGDGDPTAVDTTARVRFFNATTGMTGGGGFTTNGQFATGSALASGPIDANVLNGQRRPDIVWLRRSKIRVVRA
jgi:hypothetical protein